MRHREQTHASSGAVATGAAAAGAASLGAMLLGAVALGAVAVGAVAVGRLSVRRARMRRLEIDDLTIGRLTIGPGAQTVVARLRARPGRGEELAQMIAGAVADSAPRAHVQAQRSDGNADLFLLQVAWPDAGSPPVLERIIRDATTHGLLADTSGDPVSIEVYRGI